MKKLVIWDFDGVIADSEKLWVGIWADMLKEYKGIELTEAEKKQHLTGISHKSKIKRLKAAFAGLDFDETYLKELDRRKIEGIEQVMEVTPGVEDILKDERLKYCIATGASKNMNDRKLKRLGFEKYFNKQNCFTVDMVENGKPAPDLFLFAARKMGMKPHECVVVEDSVMGFRAAKAAGMTVIAFVGAENNNTPEYKEICKSEGVYRVCATMKEVKQTLDTLLRPRENLNMITKNVPGR